MLFWLDISTCTFSHCLAHKGIMQVYCSLMFDLYRIKISRWNVWIAASGPMLLNRVSAICRKDVPIVAELNISFFSRTTAFEILYVKAAILKENKHKIDYKIKWAYIRKCYCQILCRLELFSNKSNFTLRTMLAAVYIISNRTSGIKLLGNSA